jgi:formylglycine-generating enzyme required for sulfatase activity
MLALLSLLATACTAAAGGPHPAGRTLRDCPDCPEMAVLPPGRFLMGSTEEETAREHVPAHQAAPERPQHEVTIGYPLAVSLTEITRAQYAAKA